ncbi:hypothetical protein GGR57DRAFT_272234 [Xylariaceae sp. FL1272]|nr:hypothetical protein GGR57DRAFT_272234 [Xylariaceae sp. FL1272]
MIVISPKHRVPCHPNDTVSSALSIDSAVTQYHLSAGTRRQSSRATTSSYSCSRCSWPRMAYSWVQRVLPRTWRRRREPLGCFHHCCTFLVWCRSLDIRSSCGRQGAKFCSLSCRSIATADRGGVVRFGLFIVIGMLNALLKWMRRDAVCGCDVRWSMRVVT